MKITHAESRAGGHEHFTGDVSLYDISRGSRVHVLSVHFMPGARTVWHTHPLGQTLHVTEGVGLIQRRGGGVERVQVGDIVRFDPYEEHWHGAHPASRMTHLAMQEVADNGDTSYWGPHVTDEEYSAGAQLD